MAGDGSRFCGIFSNDKVNGWGIYGHKDYDIYQGEYQNDRTSDYGEYYHGNGAIYYGYWVDGIQFGMILLNIQENIKMTKKGIGTYKWLD